MITKRIPMRNAKASSFARLTEYITHSQGKHERVGRVRLTNCQSDAAPWAALEIKQTQDRNQRTQMDKTYHLLVSFPEGERPAPEVLHAIEDRLCAVIGYGEHQRISAVHHDTDHVHLHIAVNKIHPKKFTAHEPYFDKRKLGAECEKLEAEYNLKLENHKPRMTAGEAKAQDMEKAAGLESLIGWVKRGCLNNLLAAPSWQKLHGTLAQNGLQLSPRGNGLVITDGKGNAAKASSINRQLSLSALEKKLGPYQAHSKPDIKATVIYQVKPMPSKIDTSRLWRQYLEERANLKARLPAELQQASDKRKRLTDAAKRGARLERERIKWLKGKIVKKMLYHSASQKLLRKIKKINQDYIQQRQQLYHQGKQPIWHDWLKLKASQGNADALAVLRHRYENEASHQNALTGTAPQNDNRQSFKPLDKIETVTKKGTVHYQSSSAVVRDNGKKLWIANDASDDALRSMLQLAIRRFGTRLEINGTEKFRSAIVETAAQAMLNITFTDPLMEARRQALMQKEDARHRNHSIQTHAEKYIAERNDKNAKGLDVLKHRGYNPSDAGRYAYAGIRQVENTNLMLLKTSSEILVLPVDSKTAYRARSIPIGTTVEIMPDGTWRNYGRNHAREQRKAR